jgi:hypothetical protein
VPGSVVSAELDPRVLNRARGGLTPSSPLAGKPGTDASTLPRGAKKGPAGVMADGARGKLRI